MNFEIKATDYFERRLKRLSEKYKSLLDDLLKIIGQLSDDPYFGTPLGKDCYKIRIAIASKGKGKSGGARLITYVRIVKNTIFLMDIFYKAELENVSPQELQKLINKLSA